MDAVDEIREAIRLMIEESGARKELAHRLAKRRGWHCSARTAEGKVTQMAMRVDAHRFWIEDLPDLLETTGRDYLTPILQRVLLRLELCREPLHEARPVARRLRA